MRTRTTLTAALILTLHGAVLAQDPSASPAAASPASPAPEGATRVKTLSQGTDAGQMTEKSIVTVTSAADFEALWKKVHANVTPAPELPAIDWATTQVIAAFAGQKNTGGWSIQLRRLVAGPEGSTIELADVGPGPDDMVTEALTSPYMMIEVPAGRPVKAGWVEEQTEGSK